MQSPLLALDTEMATQQGAPHLLEIAAVRFFEGEALDHFESLVRPEVPIAPETSDVHGLEDGDVRDAPPVDEVLDAFAAWAGEDWVIAHDAKKDGAVLAFEAERHRRPLPKGFLLDSLSLSRRLLPDAPDHKLATLCEYLELDMHVEHRALPDATVCWQVVEACIERLGGWSVVSEAKLLESSRAAIDWERTRPQRASRRPSIVRPLERASRERAEVRLYYGEEGAQPVPLSVLPRLVYQRSGKGYLEGECVRSGTLKTYRLDRVHRVLQNGS